MSERLLEGLKENEKLSHSKARFERPPMYPERFQIPDDKIKWEVEYPEYKPPYFVAKIVLDNDITKNPKGWADPEDIRAVEKERLSQSYEGVIKLDQNGKPLNPRGRTGLKGRGLLGRWGANYAADPVVTKINFDTGLIEMIAIQRKDNKQWAIPGGMMDKGEAVSQTLKREFREETGVDLDMSDAVEVYKGYVDDPRNTDNAWMETTAMHKHLSSDMALKIKPEAGDDAKDVQWLTLNVENITSLYASHSELIKKVLIKFYEDGKDRLLQQTKKQIEDIIKTA